MTKQIRFLRLRNIIDTSQLGWYLHKNYMRMKTNRRFDKLNLNKIKLSRGLKLDVLGIEFTSICDLNCRWCSLDRTKRLGYMKIELLDKILKEVVKKENKIKNIALHHAGETILHPKLKEMLDLLGEYKKQNPNFPKVSLLTNANSLTKEKSQTIINSGAVDWVRFSIDGGNKKDFEYIRRGAKWEKILENVHNFLNLNKEISTSIFTILKDKKRFSGDFLKLIKRVDEHKIIFPHDWSGDIEFKEKKYRKMINLAKNEPGGCSRALNSMDVLWNGDIVPCCSDLNGRLVIGNLNKNSLLDVYKGEKRLWILNKMKKKRRGEIGLCRNCREV